MQAIVVAIRGILIGQTYPSWPDKLGVWLFRRGPQNKLLKKEPFPPIWLIAHSNGAHIALLITKKLIARGCWIGGIILTRAACAAKIESNAALPWLHASQLGGTR